MIALIYKYIGDHFRVHTIQYEDNSISIHLEMRQGNSYRKDANLEDTESIQQQPADRSGDHQGTWFLVSQCSSMEGVTEAIERIETQMKLNITCWFEIKGHRIQSIERDQRGWLVLTKKGLTFTGATRQQMQVLLEMYESSKEATELLHLKEPAHLSLDTSEETHLTQPKKSEVSKQENFKATYGDILLYDSKIHGLVEVMFIKLNEVENWPIKTAQVYLYENEISARVNDLTPTGERTSAVPKTKLSFGKSMASKIRQIGQSS